jgi:hypothetical protein
MELLYTDQLRSMHNKADELRVHALFSGTFFLQWAGEFWGICKGHSFAIWRCTRTVQCLGNEILVSWFQYDGEARVKYPSS